jgi:hypothetical protein
MAEEPTTGESPDTKAGQADGSGTRFRDDRPAGHHGRHTRRLEGHERNDHWEGVIHYQDSRKPRSENPYRGDWDGVQQTRTTGTDLETERLITQVQSRSVKETQDLERSLDRSLSR